MILGSPTCLEAGRDAEPLTTAHCQRVCPAGQANPQRAALHGSLGSWDQLIDKRQFTTLGANSSYLPRS